LVIDLATERYSHTSQSEKDLKGLVLSAAAGIVDEFTDQRKLTEPITDSVRGIIDGINSTSDRPFTALMEAMSVDSPESYAQVTLTWRDQTNAWYQSKNGSGINPQANATIVVSLSDDEGTPIRDSLILIKDDAGNIKTVSLSLEPHQPMYNQSSPATMSFYVNADQWLGIHPHRVSVEVTSGTTFAKYSPIEDQPISNETFHVIEPNQFTYVDLRVRRDTSGSYMLYSADDQAITAKVDTAYPPFPDSALFPNV
jgi:hypothetical protein